MQQLHEGGQDSKSAYLMQIDAMKQQLQAIPTNIFR